MASEKARRRAVARPARPRRSSLSDDRQQKALCFFPLLGSPFLLFKIPRDGPTTAAAITFVFDDRPPFLCLSPPLCLPPDHKFVEFESAPRELFCETPQETEWMDGGAGAGGGGLAWWGSCARGNSLRHRRRRFAIRKMNPAFLSAPSLALRQPSGRRRFLPRASHQNSVITLLFCLSYPPRPNGGPSRSGDSHNGNPSDRMTALGSGKKVENVAPDLSLSDVVERTPHETRQMTV